MQKITKPVCPRVQCTRCVRSTAMATRHFPHCWIPIINVLDRYMGEPFTFRGTAPHIRVTHTAARERESRSRIYVRYTQTVPLPNRQMVRYYSICFENTSDFRFFEAEQAVIVFLNSFIKVGLRNWRPGKQN